MKTSTETRSEVQVSAKFSLNQLVEKKKKTEPHIYGQSIYNKENTAIGKRWPFQ